MGAIWPDVPEAERPVGAITNGIHVSTWISAEMSKLFERHLGADWRERARRSGAVGRRCSAIPDEELWAVAPGAAQLPVRLHPRTRAAAVDGGTRQRGARRRGRHAARSRTR